VILFSPLSPTIRKVVAVGAILLCLATAWISAKAALSRLMAKSSTIVNSLALAQQAVQLTPNDPEAHRALASMLRNEDRVAEAEFELEIAANLRPRDDLLWLDLGLVRDRLEDNDGAIAALNESVRLAPYYAHPRWQRGNVLLRQGRYDDAFADLRQAANSNPDLQLNLIDLTWGISKYDPKLTEAILQIDNEQMRVAFARFLARKGLGIEALDQFRKCAYVSPQIRKEMVYNLIARKSFSEAFAIWSNGSAAPAIFDGGFEAPLSLEEIGFGWRVTREEGMSLSIDTTEKQSGTKSLRVQFGGNSNVSEPVVSQLVLVEPGKHYRLNFAARTQEVVAGGLPVVSIVSASNDKPLAKSTPLKAGTNPWEVTSVEFTPDADTRAVWIKLVREPCSSNPCPIFGVVWLDSFSFETLQDAEKAAPKT
jgi:tetratricopeptide (TPR) repeat protein